MESKGHLYIYIHQVLNEINSIFYKLITVYYSTDKNLQSLGTVAVIGLDKAGKIIQGHKIVGSIICAIS
jgi:hypothetical protein